jgi:tetratricopeptide (TPR) repeat protein
MDGAIADQTRAIELDPGFALAYFNRGAARSAKHDLAGAKADLEASITANSQMATAYDALGWLLATAEQPAIRDGQRAVWASLRACELTRWNNATYLSTLAAAYARNGEYAKAVESEQRAMLEDPRLARAVQERAHLQLYRSGKAWPPD